MKILIAAHVFSPMVGGIESVTLDLALAFANQGHEVQVITPTPSVDPKDDHGLKVIRSSGKSDLIRAVRWCDVYLQSNISLQTAWPLLFIRRPWVVCTHTWIRRTNGSTGLADRFKKFLLRFATNIYISKAIRDHVGCKGSIIPNPYNDGLFRVIPGIARERSLVFLGRLVSDKGCDLMIESLAQLRDAGWAMPLTIIGSGSEEEALKKSVVEKRLGGLVTFAGVLRGESLARELNRHEVLVVPSRWEEPFGMVAVEGIACGCLVVGSNRGGLSDAIGPCGLTFKSGDAADLTRAIREIFEKREALPPSQKAIANHLNDHRAEVTAARYLEIFESLCSKNDKKHAFAN
jgi:glycosyltransferase involved in cell wall biosynthesis